MKNAEAGITKRVSESVYPNDILSEQALAGADPAVKGGWLWVLLYLWRDNKSSISDTLEGWARAWGCDVKEAERIIYEIKNRRIGNVTKRNKTVTLTCRRLKRREDVRKDTAERVAKHRAKEVSNASVTGEFQSAEEEEEKEEESSVVVRVVKDVNAASSQIEGVGTECPPPSKSDDEPVSPPQDHMAVTNLVNQFRKAAQWTGSRNPLYQQFISALELFTAEEISEEITRAVPAEKPWETLDRLKKRKSIEKREFKRPAIPPRPPVDESWAQDQAERAKAFIDKGGKIRDWIKSKAFMSDELIAVEKALKSLINSKAQLDSGARK